MVARLEIVRKKDRRNRNTIERKKRRERTIGKKGDEEEK